MFLIKLFLITKCDCISNIVTFAVNVAAIIFIILKAEKYIMLHKNKIKYIKLFTKINVNKKVTKCSKWFISNKKRKVRKESLSGIALEVWL